MCNSMCNCIMGNILSLWNTGETARPDVMSMQPKSATANILNYLRAAKARHLGNVLGERCRISSRRRQKHSQKIPRRLCRFCTRPPWRVCCTPHGPKQSSPNQSKWRHVLGAALLQLATLSRPQTSGRAKSRTNMHFLHRQHNSDLL